MGSDKLTREYVENRLLFENNYILFDKNVKNALHTDFSENVSNPPQFTLVFTVFTEYLFIFCEQLWINSIKLYDN